jgi:hypothetical protein
MAPVPELEPGDKWKAVGFPAADDIADPLADIRCFSSHVRLATSQASLISGALRPHVEKNVGRRFFMMTSLEPGYPSSPREQKKPRLDQASNIITEVE